MSLREISILGRLAPVVIFVWSVNGGDIPRGSQGKTYQGKKSVSFMICARQTGNRANGFPLRSPSPLPSAHSRPACPSASERIPHCLRTARSLDPQEKTEDFREKKINSSYVENSARKKNISQRLMQIKIERKSCY